nr:ribonuclease H-like domain-containing protein [Tanacetum cinerariifolium]
GVNTASSQVNASALNIDNLSDAVICAFLASHPNSTQLVNEDLEQIHPDDLEKMDLNHFIKECQEPKGQANKSRDATRKTMPVEKLNSSALVSCDGLGGYDWNDEEEEVEKQEVKPTFNRINFVKATTDNNLKETVKTGEQPKQNTHRKRAPTVNATRRFNAVHPKRTINAVNQKSYFSKQARSSVLRPNKKLTAIKNSYDNKKVKTIWVKKVNTAKPKATVNAAKTKAKYNVVKGKSGNAIKASTCWVWKTKHNVLDHVSRHESASITLKKFDYVDARGNPQEHLQDKGVINSGCSRHMTGNMSFLIDYEEINEGYVASGGNLQGGKITGKAQTPQQNRVAERRNKTLIEVARTMLADSKLPTTFWVEVVNTACYVQNSVLVTKPHNKTPYELFHGRTHAIRFLRPFGCPVTILNTIDHLGEEDNTNSTNKVNIVTLSINTASSSKINIVGTNISIDLPLDPNMPSLEYIDIFKDSHDDEAAFGAEADFHNLDFTFQVSLIPTIRIHKDHPLEQVIGDLHSAP